MWCIFSAESITVRGSDSSSMCVTKNDLNSSSGEVDDVYIQVFMSQKDEEDIPSNDGEFNVGNVC